MVSAPARCELMRHMKGSGLSERLSLAIADMRASAYRYVALPDRYVDQILAGSSVF
ncbi:hypothetical protein GCM10010872_14870 [Dyella flava]|nr:hypothetical protein GCM10010872_14870 [Dyella flava]